MLKIRLFWGLKFTKLKYFLIGNIIYDFSSSVHMLYCISLSKLCWCFKVSCMKVQLSISTTQQTQHQNRIEYESMQCNIVASEVT